MKEIEFQHFKKAPHPFQKYGNLPPTALNNRSISQDYGSLPQGQQPFTIKGGKRQFDNKHKSSIKKHWLGQTGIDSLSQQIARHHNVKGKSLETRDIQGAQGGSLKSAAVKYKQKAQQLKLYGKLNGYDQYDYEQEQYKLKIQNAVKSQHTNDVQIGKLISWKGHGHILNPQNKELPLKQQQNIFKKNNKDMNQYQHSLKQKYDDFESKNQHYKQFFKDKKNKEQNYDQFFNKIKQKNYPQSEPQRKPQFEQQNKIEKNISKQMPTLKITSKQHEYSISQKYKTVEIQNQIRRQQQQIKKRQDAWKKQQFMKNYQPPNYPKRSLGSQFREQQKLGVSLNSQRNYQNQYEQLAPIINSSRKSENNEKQKKNSIFEAKLSRKLNPTNLSHIINSGSFNFGSNSYF